jgi:serine/threonine protein kinase
MNLLDSRQKFPESWSRFYGATVLTAFKYIHQKRIAFRDLKPENLVLDANGYCYLVDFGLAKICEKGKTWTFCGTPDYLAPEVLSGKGHDWGVDCWGLGLFLDEITHGFAPFYADDPTKTARNIIRGRFAIPSSFSESLSDLIRRLLVSQERRLGRIKGGAEEVKKHQWFSGFDWEALLNQQMKVPWKPKVGDLGSIGKMDRDDDSPPDSDWNPVFDVEDEY